MWPSTAGPARFSDTVDCDSYIEKQSAPHAWDGSTYLRTIQKRSPTDPHMMLPACPKSRPRVLPNLSRRLLMAKFSTTTPNWPTAPKARTDKARAKVIGSYCLADYEQPCLAMACHKQPWPDMACFSSASQWFDWVRDGIIAPIRIESLPIA